MRTPANADGVREFTEGGSEEAFTRVVVRYAPLVHSSARRLVGDFGHARDVTQRVFLDLLNKRPVVRRLLEQEANPAAYSALLAGWLLRATRYEALELLRSESRRRARELTAMELHPPSPTADPDSLWATISPELDEALDTLGETDRRALLMRYFDEAGFREIGTALELSEDAAQKRVSRALEQLRERFSSQGIKTTAGALGTALVAHAVEPLPSGLDVQVASAAWAQGIGAGTAVPFGLHPPAAVGPGLGRVPTQFVARVGAMLLVGFLAWWTAGRQPASPLFEGPGPTAQRPAVAAAAAPAAAGVPTEVAMASPAGETRRLSLEVVSAETGLPLSQVQMSVAIVGEHWQGRVHAPGQTDDQGRAELLYGGDITRLSIRLNREGFADTQLAWQPERGREIPSAYRAQLPLAPRIGGTVVAADGTPLTNTMVQFHLSDQDPRIAQVETRTGDFQVLTDAKGRWTTARVAEELLPRIEGTPWRTDYLSHGWTRFSSEPNAIPQLLAGEYIFTLQPGLAIRGMVVDPENRPVPNARITLGNYYSNQRVAQSDVNGAFDLRGCEPGRQIVTAMDEKLGVGFRIVDVSPRNPPLSVTLEPFRTLRLRTVDLEGNAVPQVQVRWLTVGPDGKTDNDKPGDPSAQYRFEGRTDAAGQLVWAEAPANRLLMSFDAKHHAQRNGLDVLADGSEQTVVLEPMFPPQVIRGTVRDAITGTNVSHFRIRGGSPRQRQDGRVEQDWELNSTYSADFTEGRFDLTFENKGNVDPSRLQRVFHISAPGYESGVTRVIRGDEEGVILDVMLQKAKQGNARVLRPDGSPAAGVPVVAAYPGHRIQILPGEARPLEDYAGELPLDSATDPSGVFRFRSTETLRFIVCADGDGIGWGTSDSLWAGGVITMEPWSAMTGTIRSVATSQVVPSVVIQPERDLNFGDHEPIEWQGFEAIPDEEGRFEFPRVPPGRLKLGHWISGKDGRRTFQKLREMAATAGEQMQVELVYPAE